MDVRINATSVIPIRCPNCSKFLFEAAPGFQARVIIKCRCDEYVEITDIYKPVIISDYVSPNQKTFTFNNGQNPRGQRHSGR